jgi:hypothetical protein
MLLFVSLADSQAPSQFLLWPIRANTERTLRSPTPIIRLAEPVNPRASENSIDIVLIMSIELVDIITW